LAVAKINKKDKKMTASNHAIPQKNYEYVRNALLQRREIAFLVVRE
jgi:hypothetical protein